MTSFCVWIVLELLPLGFFRFSAALHVDILWSPVKCENLSLGDPFHRWIETAKITKIHSRVLLSLRDRCQCSFYHWGDRSVSARLGIPFNLETEEYWRVVRHSVNRCAVVVLVCHSHSQNYVVVRYCRAKHWRGDVVLHIWTSSQFIVVFLAQSWTYAMNPGPGSAVFWAVQGWALPSTLAIFGSSSHMTAFTRSSALAAIHGTHEMS